MILETSNTTRVAFIVTRIAYRTLTASNVSRAGTGNMNYTFTFPTAHPHGTNASAIATPLTSDSRIWSSMYHFTCTTKVQAGGSGVSMWRRNAGTDQGFSVGYLHGGFYFYTVFKKAAIL